MVSPLPRSDLWYVPGSTQIHIPYLFSVQEIIVLIPHHMLDATTGIVLKKRKTPITTILQC